MIVLISLILNSSLSVLLFYDAHCVNYSFQGHFMYVDNRNYYGFLVASDDFDTTKLHPEMYQIFDNPDVRIDPRVFSFITNLMSTV